MQISSRIAMLACGLLLGQAAISALPQAASAEWTEADVPCNVEPGALLPQRVWYELGELAKPKPGYFTYGAVFPSEGPPTSEFTAVANWGDGATSPATVGGASSGGDCYAVSAPGHIYANTGTFPFSYTVHDAKTGLNHALGAEDLRVWSVVPTLLGGPSTRAIHATVGVPWTGVVGEFVAEGAVTPTYPYTAEIEWGAGGPLTTGTIGTLDNKTFTVSGSFTYEQPLTGAIRVLLSGGWKGLLGTWVTSGVDVVAPVVAPEPLPAELRGGSILADISRPTGGPLYELVFRTDRSLPHTHSGEVEAHVKVNGQTDPVSHLTARESTCYVAQLGGLGNTRPKRGARYLYTLAVDAGLATRDTGHALLSRFATLRSMRSLEAKRLGCA